MTENERPVLWQRVPQGWIELVAFADDDLARKWWQAYLAPAASLQRAGVLDEETIATLTNGFTAARGALGGSAYSVAGILPYLIDEPTVFFIGTAVLPVPADPRAARAAAGFAGLVRFAEDVRTEAFVALDGRLGSASLGTATTPDGAVVAAITGQIPLAEGDGTVFVLALSLDPSRLDELVPYAALALDSTRLLGADDAPEAYPPAEWLAADSAARQP